MLGDVSSSLKHAVEVQRLLLYITERVYAGDHRHSVL